MLYYLTETLSLQVLFLAVIKKGITNININIFLFTSSVAVLQTDLCESDRGFSLSLPLLLQLLPLLPRSEGQLLHIGRLNLEVAGLDGLEGENVTRKTMSGPKR